jgi:leader peptidase (prepilin peptidase)/N-methyltransferase
MLSDLASVYTTSPGLFAGSVFVIGLLVGSFLNVVIYRLPIMLERDWRLQASEILAPATDAPAAVPPPVFNLVTPRSACPSCRTPIKAWQNIPVLSWLALRGRCAGCGTSISVRYPLAAGRHHVVPALGRLARRGCHRTDSGHRTARLAA